MTEAPYRIEFDELKEMNQQRASNRLPIMCFIDWAENEDLVRGYVHADFMSVYVVRSGSGVHVVDGVPFEVQAGDVYAMGFGMTHRYTNSDHLVLDTVHFRPSLFAPETREALAATEGLAPMFLGFSGQGSSRWLRLGRANHLQAIEMLQEMRAEWEFDTPDRALMVQASFLRFLVFLARQHRSSNRGGSRVGARAKELIEHRYAEPLKISDLAASSFLSIGRFTEVFRAEVGCSPREYLGRVRIGAAKHLLRETDLTVASIAERTGFPDAGYFARFFRQQVGLTPSEFRGEV